MKELIFGSGPEQPLGRLIKPFGDMVQNGRSVVPWRAFKLVFQKFPGSAADEY